jgi:hypothetical protein
MATVKEVIERLSTLYNPEEVIAVPIWCVDDVREQAEEMGINLSREKAEEIVERIDQKHDATIGINWDVINFHIQDAG